MKQQRSSLLSLKVAGLALALFGLSAVPGLGSIGGAQASPLSLTQSISSSVRVGAGDHAVILVGRGKNDSKRCPRSNDGCEKDLPPLPPPTPPQQ
jgi:hypothetical protein